MFSKDSETNKCDLYRSLLEIIVRTWEEKGDARLATTLKKDDDGRISVMTGTGDILLCVENQEQGGYYFPLDFNQTGVPRTNTGMEQAYGSNNSIYEFDEDELDPEEMHYEISQLNAAYSTLAEEFDSFKQDILSKLASIATHVAADQTSGRQLTSRVDEIKNRYSEMEEWSTQVERILGYVIETLESDAGDSGELKLFKGY